MQIIFWCPFGVSAKGCYMNNFISFAMSERIDKRMKKFNIAVVGATGMVGRTFLKVLEEEKLPVENYYLFASKKSAGKKVTFMGKEYVVEDRGGAIQGNRIDIYMDSHAEALAWGVKYLPVQVAQ